MKKIAIAALLSAFVASPAFAAGEGPYVGVKVGQSDVGGTATGFGVYGGYNIDQNATKNWFGGSAFMQKVSWGGEVEYTDLGSTSVFGVEDKANVIGAAMAATYPINPQFSATAKAGVARTTHDFTTRLCLFTCISMGASVSTIGLHAGIAGQYNLTEKIGLRAGYDVYPDGFSQLSAGAVFKF